MNRTVCQAFAPISRSISRTGPRYESHRLRLVISRIYSAQSSRQCLSTNRHLFSPEPITSLEPGPEAPPKRPFISYTTATVVAFVAGSFLAYRLFFYHPNSDDEPLNPSTFASRKLTLKQRISPTLSIFNLSSGRGDGGDDLWTKGVWSVEVKQPQLQIARSYTPLPPVKMLEESEGAWMNRTKGLRLLIRQEPMGEVSGYVHRLSEGAKLEIRGPHPELALSDDVREVVFLAGGTGIAPALQVAYALSRRAATGRGSYGPVRMSILWSSRTRDDTGDNSGAAVGSFQDRYASIPGQLQALEGASRGSQGFELSTKTFVDDEKTFLGATELNYVLASGKETEGRKLILVSGPEGFVSHVAGPKVLENGVEAQGPLSGLLFRLDCRGWQVWKL